MTSSVQHYAMQGLDPLNRDLIAILREDGRAPISKLAAILGVSRTTVQNRLDQLQDNGVVMGFTIRTRDDDREETVRAVMLIEVRDRNAAAVIRQLRGMPELRRLHSTNGKWDIVADLTARDLRDFDRVLGEVREIPGITNSETSILLSAV